MSNFSCGHCGHIKESCPTLYVQEKLGSENVALKLSARSSGSKVNHQKVEKFGPWMLVDWLTKRANQIKGTYKVVKESANPKGSRFTTLLNLRDNEIDIVQNIMSEFNVKSKGKCLAIYDNPLVVDNSILDRGNGIKVGPRDMVNEL
ncbi:hypothetical protein Golob_026407, partial [Gossypium lobatum]|nr:hypothetical protein [Gossypium lobatum]